MLLKRNNVERVIEDAGKAESMIKEGYVVVEANNLPEKDNPEGSGTSVHPVLFNPIPDSASSTLTAI